MKLVIAGGRNYALTTEDIAKLDAIRAEHPDLHVVHGGCSGVDSYAWAWGVKHGLKIACFCPQWKEHGKAAGPIRNRKMAAFADAAALFPGGRGTANMHAEAVKAGLRIFDFRNLDGGGKE